MFLEEMSLSIHMRAVEQPVAIDLLVIEILSFLHLHIGVCLIPHIVLVSLRVILLVPTCSTLTVLLLLATLIKSIL
jgi:hypothetical protein